MYYYGGYSGNSNACYGNNNYTSAGYNYPYTQGYYGGGFGYGNGYGSGAAIVLVLFILLVIIIGSRSFISA